MTNLIPQKALEESGVPKGAWWVCKYDHKIAQAIEDIHPGEINWGAKIGNWQQRKIQEGTLLSDWRCEHCKIPIAPIRLWTYPEPATIIEEALYFAAAEIYSA